MGVSNREAALPCSSPTLTATWSSDPFGSGLGIACCAWSWRLVCLKSFSVPIFHDFVLWKGAEPLFGGMPFSVGVSSVACGWTWVTQGHPSGRFSLRLTLTCP